MRLAAAAKYFDRQVCEDPADASYTFKAQLDLFDDSKRDGTTGTRRVLSVAPDVVLPAGGVFKLAGHYFIVGEDHEDVFGGEVVRVKYVVQQAESGVKLKTLAQAAAGATGTSSYGNRVWVKDIKEVDQTSFLYPFFQVVVPTPLGVSRNMVLDFGGVLHLVRSVYSSAGGFRTCECNELSDTQPQTIAYTGRSGGAYDPVTDTVTSSAPANVAALALRYEDYYQRVSAQAEKNLPGDLCLAVAKTLVALPVAGDTWVSAAGVKYLVLSVFDDASTSWLLHSRRV